MRRYTKIARPQRRFEIKGTNVRVPVLSQPTTQAARTPQGTRGFPKTFSTTAVPDFQPDPYVDYGRYLTLEGGILLVYKDLDESPWHTLRRLLAWTAFTGAAALYLYNFAPLQMQWIKGALLLAAAIANWLVTQTSVEVYRKIEIRPNCMIIENNEIFLRRNMDLGFPSFSSSTNGGKTLTGTYGTRFIEYLTVRRFDDNDRVPELLESHLQDAMHQMWTRPL